MVDVAIPPAQDSGSVPILTVTWDTVIGARHIGYDPDSGPEVEPVSLGDAVVQGLVERLLVEIKHDVDQSSYRGAVAEAREAATKAIQAEATAMVRDALTGEFQPMTQWGEKRGQVTTLRDLIKADVEKFLAEQPPRDGYGNDRRGGFRELIRTEVELAMAKELRDTIAEARKQVVGKVQAKAAALIAEAVK